MVGDEDEVDGQRLAASAEGVRQIALQDAAAPSLQFGVVGEGGEQCVVVGAVGGRIAERGSGGDQGDDAADGVTEDGPQGTGSALESVVLEAEMFLQTVGGVGF